MVTVVRPKGTVQTDSNFAAVRAVMFLERQNGTVLECLVSREDFDRVRKHHWYLDRSGKGAFYAAAWIDGGQVHMHKYLCPNWAQVNPRTATAWTIGAENLRGVRRTVNQE